jgi:hypothetical protein
MIPDARPAVRKLINLYSVFLPALVVVLMSRSLEFVIPVLNHGEDRGW